MSAMVSVLKQQQLLFSCILLTMQNVIGVVSHVLYGRSRCGSFTRR